MKAKEIANRLNPIQRYALVLAGANNRQPIKGKLWWQKEMFLIEKNAPELSNELDYEPALMGPMSEALEWQVDQLMSIGLVESVGGAYRLTDLGKECLDGLEHEFDAEQLSMVSELKAFLNDLSKDELLAVVYFIYPDMTIESRELEELTPKRKDIAARLFAKEKLGIEKAALIAGMDVQEFSRFLKKKGVARYSD